MDLYLCRPLLLPANGVEAAAPLPAPVTAGMTRVGNHTNSSDPQSVNSRVFVGNLNTYVVGKEEVERIFSRYGRLIGISMHKGYAFVQYTDTWDARNAVVGEDGRTVAGQLLDVNMVSEPKPHQVNRKRPNFHPATFLNAGRGSLVPPLKRARTDLLGSRASLPRFTEKDQASIDSLYNNGEPDILICGNCKEVFPGIHKLIEHKKQSCKLRFTCRCQHTSSPPGAPMMPVCAQCQSRQNTWWDLVQHFQTAHNAMLYLKDEDLAAMEVSHVKEEDGSTCSNCSTSDSRNGTSLTQDCWEEQRDASTEADIREEEEDARQQPPAEDKSVDTTDLKTSLG